MSTTIHVAGARRRLADRPNRELATGTGTACVGRSVAAIVLRLSPLGSRLDGRSRLAIRYGTPGYLVTEGQRELAGDPSASGCVKGSLFGQLGAGQSHRS